MSRYLLDTDTCVLALKSQDQVLRAMRARSVADVALSVVTEAELRTGAAKSRAVTKATRLLEGFLRPLAVLSFTSEDAKVYGRVRARLEKAGTPIGPLDTLIGSHALSRRLVLVTNDVREFSRIPGLKLESWTS